MAFINLLFCNLIGQFELVLVQLEVYYLSVKFTINNLEMHECLYMLELWELPAIRGLYVHVYNVWTNPYHLYYNNMYTCIAYTLYV